MTFDSIKSDIKAGKFKPVYFLMGEEPYFIDQVTDYISENVLGESDRAFNQLVLYGRDTDMKNIIVSARRFPMMAPCQVIIVKEAQQMRNLEGLEGYLNAPMTSTCLVIAYKYKKLDKRTKFGKLLTDKDVLFESDKLREDKVPAWITGFLKNKGYGTDHKSATLLVDFLGNDLGKIANELDKLFLLLPEGSKQVTGDLIERNIGISKDYNNFELTRALAHGDVVQANRIIRYFSNNAKNNPFLLTITALFYYFVKVLQYHGLADKSRESVASELGINPYFVEEYQMAARAYPLAKTRKIITWLRECDLQSKGGSTSGEGDLMTELIYKILH